MIIDTSLQRNNSRNFSHLRAVRYKWGGGQITEKAIMNQADVILGKQLFKGAV